MPVESLRSAAKCLPVRVTLRPGFPKPGCGRLQSRESPARNPFQTRLPYPFLRVPHNRACEPCRFPPRCVQIASTPAVIALSGAPHFAQSRSPGFLREKWAAIKKEWAHRAAHREPIHELLLQETGAGRGLVGEDAAAKIAVEGVAPQGLDRECAGREGDIG